MQDLQAELFRAREIARKIRERLDAEEQELEFDRQIAACPSQKRSSVGSVRSVKSSDPGSPEQGTANLTHQSLLQHDLSQVERSAMAQALLVPKASSVARIAEALPKATAIAPAVPDFPLNLSAHLAAAKTPCEASRNPERHVTVAKACPSEAGKEKDFSNAFA